MKTSLLVLAAAIASLATASPLKAQHLHWHGNHWDLHQNAPHFHDEAGHMIDSYGHHIDGDGHHTGSIGVYEDGSTNQPWVSNYYNYPTYPSTSSWYSSGYTPAPTVVYSTPRAANAIPSPAMGPLGGSFVLTNPPENRGTIRYSLNQYTYTMNPGDTQRVNIDRDWVIKFDNGLNRTVSYRLQQGNYAFTVSPQSGWDVIRSTATAPVSFSGAASQTTNSIPSLFDNAPTQGLQ